MKNYENSLVALIERKINNEMEGEELEKFDELLRTDPDAKKEYELQKSVHKAIGELDVVDLRQNLKSIHEKTRKDREEPSVVRSLFRSKLHRIAAAAFFLILMLSIASIYVLNTGKPVSNDSLFKIYYQPDAALLVRGQAEDKLLIEGFQKYENRDYAGALKLFIRILEKDPNNMPVQFYAGISSIELGKYRNALKPFNYIVTHNHNLYVEKAKWYAGLCYIKMNENEKAFEIFKEISDSNSSYRYKAKHIMKGLRR